ncbi:potassium channel family protein [Bifidobacterium sp. 64T4]|uniref:potassium channel family protein n=1 Tax=Bifidobacterium pongonis TaxID=2834432 RepID=UPI001C5862D6|nr:potassium channel family protein [Bifidobacterium pongonis]MBW3094087.1 potassium channel family protein [Bifidobacterium pongonis]
MTLSKWQRITEWPMTALALVFLFAYSWEVLARTHIALCENAINIIWVVFIIDYVASISLARNKKAWFKNNLITLLSIVLPIFRPLRLLRLVAVLNVLNRTSGMAVRGRITMYVCSSAVLLIYIGSLAILDVERAAPGAKITDFGKALWWTFVTVTTVGYGDLSPVTWQGKCIAVGLMVTGIALIGIVTATLASWIVDRVDSETDKRAQESSSEIQQLRSSVAELNATVAALHDELREHRADMAAIGITPATGAGAADSPVATATATAEER